MDVTDAYHKHTCIIDSLVDPLVFAGQQLQLTPPSEFEGAMLELRDDVKPDLPCVCLMEEHGEDINIDVYFSSLVGNLENFTCQ